MKFVVLCLLLKSTQYCSALTVAAFNVQVFGIAKFSDDSVVSILSQIVQRYDVTLIQELRDSSQTVIYSFVDQINSNGEKYAVIVSERLGRTSSKEQYAFIYRTDRVDIVDSFQYDDTVKDEFEREPFSVLVKSKAEDIPLFFLMGIHVKPIDVFGELNALARVFGEAVDYFGTPNGIPLGDFNAGCTYLSGCEYIGLTLVMDPKFTWLFDWTVDTTTGSTCCAYDRVVVAGDITDYVVPGSAQVFLFDEFYRLTEEETAGVSDHYPVEFELRAPLQIL